MRWMQMYTLSTPDPKVTGHLAWATVTANRAGSVKARWLNTLKLATSIALACALLQGSAPQEPARPALSPSQIAEYRKSLKMPLAKTIRGFFRQYHSKARAEAIDLVLCDELQKHADAETQSRFVLALVEGNLFGGEWATIIFQAKPNVIIRVWVKNNEVMAVVDSTRSKAEQKKMVAMAADFLADPKFGI